MIVGYQDLAGPNESGAAGLDLSSLAVAIDGVDRTSLFSRGAAQATAQLSAADPLTDAFYIRDVLPSALPERASGVTITPGAAPGSLRISVGLTGLDGQVLVYNRPDPVHSLLIAAGRGRHEALAKLIRAQTSEPV